MSIFNRIFGPPVPTPPPKPIFQGAEGIVPIISSLCSRNEEVKYVYYKTVQDAHLNYYLDTLNFKSTKDSLKPYWDTRYSKQMNPLLNTVHHDIYSGLDTTTGIENTSIGTLAATYEPSGSVIQSECVNDVLTAGTVINLWDAPNQNILYGGPQSTFAYSLDFDTTPWSANAGNLMMQANFDKPIYTNYERNQGGNINFGVFLYNEKLKIIDLSADFRF